MPDYYDILSQAAAGDPLAEKLAFNIIMQGVRVYFRCNGSMSLQRCCGIPAATGKLLRPRRDYWLRIAYHNCQGENPRQKSQQLERELALFKSTFWNKWRLLKSPPEGTSQLRNALFHAAQFAAQIRPENPMGAIPKGRRLYDIVQNSPAEIADDPRDYEA